MCVCVCVFVYFDMMVFVCHQLRVSLTDGWTSCHDVTCSSLLHSHDDVDVVFDMTSSAASSDVTVHVTLHYAHVYQSSISRLLL